MTIWIHRSGKVIYLEPQVPGTVGVETWSLLGEPGSESSAFGTISVTRSFASARAFALDSVGERFGVGVKLSHSWVGFRQVTPWPTSGELESTIAFEPAYYFNVQPVSEDVAYRPVVLSVPVSGELVENHDE